MTTNLRTNNMLIEYISANMDKSMAFVMCMSFVNFCGLIVVLAYVQRFAEKYETDQGREVCAADESGEEGHG